MAVHIHMPTNPPGYLARWRHQTRLKRRQLGQCFRCGTPLKEGAKHVTCHSCRIKRAAKYHAKKNNTP